MCIMAMGTVALDDIKTESGIKKDLLGGSVTHFSMSASLFTKVHLGGIIGKDFPKRHIQLLKKKGIDIRSLVESQGKTFHWKGEYKKGDYNNAITLATELGVIQNYTPKIDEKQRKIPNVFLANIDPETQMKFLDLMDNPKFVGLDTMNLWINTMKKSLLKLVKKVDLFVLNDGESRLITGEANVIKVAKMLRKLGPKFIVIKKGEHGVFFFSDKCSFGFPAYPVAKVIDPTGAGDTFAGGLMGFLASAKKINESTLRRAVIYATILSSFNVEGFGMAKTAPLTMGVVNKRLKEFINFVRP